MTLGCKRQAPRNIIMKGPRAQRINPIFLQDWSRRISTDGGNDILPVLPHLPSPWPFIKNDQKRHHAAQHGRIFWYLATSLHLNEMLRTFDQQAADAIVTPNAPRLVERLVRVRGFHLEVLFKPLETDCLRKPSLCEFPLQKLCTHVSHKP